VFLDNEEERQKMLKQLRDALEDNCIESVRIKTANEIREQLEHVSEPKRSVKNVTKVTNRFKSRSCQFNFRHLHTLATVCNRNIERLYPKSKSIRQKTTDCRSLINRLRVCFNWVTEKFETKISDHLKFSLFIYSFLRLIQIF